MNIIDKEDNSKSERIVFKELAIGDTFRWGSIIFMKVHPAKVQTVIDKPAFNVNAIELNEFNAYANFEDDIEVIIANIKAIVE